MPSYLALDKTLPVAATLPFLTVLEGRTLLLMVAGAPGGQLAADPPAGAADFTRAWQEARMDASRLAALLSEELARRTAPCGTLSEASQAWRWSEPRTGAGLVSALVAGLRGCRCHDIDVDALEHIVLLSLLADLPMPHVVSVDINPRVMKQIEALGQHDIEAMLSTLLKARATSRPHE